MIGRETMAIVIAIVAASIAAAGVTAVPPIAAEFYGTVTIDGNPAPPGTGIAIHDAQGVVCGSQATARQGEFGLLSCNGDDPSTPRDEGANNGEEVVISVNSIPAMNATWHEGRLALLSVEAGSTLPVRLGSSWFPSTFVIPGIALLLAISTYVYVRKGQ